MRQQHQHQSYKRKQAAEDDENCPPDEDVVFGLFFEANETGL
jgi:hypothetical protein